MNGRWTDRLRAASCAAGLLAGGVGCGSAQGAPDSIVVPMPDTPVTATVPGTPPEVSARVEAWLAGTRPSFVDDKGTRVFFDPASFQRPELGVPGLREFTLRYNRDGKGEVEGTLFRPPAAGDTQSEVARLYAGVPEVKDPALDAYMALPPAARAHDLQVSSWFRYPSWTAAEYTGDGGRSLPYQSGYFVHFAPAGAGTTIQVIGYDAEVEKGTEWSTRGGDGLDIFPRKQARLWKAKPSHADKQAVLAGLVRGAK